MLTDLQLATTFLISASSAPFIDYSYEFNICKIYFVGLYILIDTLRIVCDFNFLYNPYFYHHVTTLGIVHKVLDTKQCVHLCNPPMFLESSAFVCILSRKYNAYKWLSKVYWLFDRLVRFPLSMLMNKTCAQYFFVELSVLVFLSSYWSFEMLQIRNRIPISLGYACCFSLAYVFS